MDSDRRGSSTVDLQHLVLRGRNPRSMNIDVVSTSELLEIINAEDRLVPEAVGKTLPEITSSGRRNRRGPSAKAAA